MDAGVEETDNMKLYSYFRSSASYRVRIALNLKNLPYDYVPVHLVRDGGEQLKPEYRKINGDGIVPTFVDGHEVYVRSVALQVACEIHPLNNLRVLKYLKHTLCVDDDAKDAWYRHWVEAGFSTLEAHLAGSARTGKLCFGDTPTLADACLIPQVFNAQRFKVGTAKFPTIQRIYDHAMQIDAFARAAPGAQPDAE
jgi:maleylpyruvate isomerase